MTAMRPEPKRAQDLDTKEDTVLDEVIAQIEQSLPIIHQRVASGGSSETPSNRLSRAEFRRAQAVFQSMKDDPLLNETGDDIRIKAEKKPIKKGAGKLGRVNGSH